MPTVFVWLTSLCVVALVALPLWCASLWWGVLWQQRRRAQQQQRSLSRVCLVVLGSGGHTSEMLRALAMLPPSVLWQPSRVRLVFVVSSTDAHSAAHARAFVRAHADAAKARAGRGAAATTASSLSSAEEREDVACEAVVLTIPRAREVGQSYRSAVRTTLHALRASLALVYATRPDVVLCNGPGVCVPVVLASYVLAACVPWRVVRPVIVYMESFACVRHVSLSGRLLAPCFVDVFTTCWRSLCAPVAALQLRGTLHYVGTERCCHHRRHHDNSNDECSAKACNSDSDDGDGSSSEDEAVGAAVHDSCGNNSHDAALSSPRYALVTVGSTRFDALVCAVVTARVCAALRQRLGVTRLLVQHGTMPREALPWLQQQQATGDDSHTVEHAADDDGDDDKDDADAASSVLCGGVRIVSFAYRPDLRDCIRGATLVITHAGAGTLLECLDACTTTTATTAATTTARCTTPTTVVVPNRQLMSDHQLELAEVLARRGFVRCVAVEDVAALLCDGNVRLDDDDDDADDNTRRRRRRRRHGCWDATALTRALTPVLQPS